MSQKELREPVFWILTALTAGRKYGYAIIQDVATLSSGSVKIAVTTLYASIERLESEGLVQSGGDEVVGGRLRRYYVITPQGESRLSVEANRLEAKVRTVRSQLAQRKATIVGGTA